MTLGSKLIDAGWRQGSVFSLPGAVLLWNGANEPRVESMTLADDETLIVASQTCDIRHDQEPRLEALVCHLDPVSAKTVLRNSARKFVVDSVSGLVASAQERLLIDKQILPSARPRNSMSAQRMDDFTRWLARRFDRPALPDLLVTLFQRPLADRIARACRAHPGSAEVLSRAVREVRANVPDADTPPFAMHVLLLLPETLSAEELVTIDMIRAEVLAAFRNSQDIDLIDVDLVLEEELSVAEYFATRPLWFEDFTYKGMEVHGAQPFHGS